MIGKFPPIQGGVSTQHYACAHALAARGHAVHVVTNAREVEPAFREMMRERDWARCERDYPSGGSVRLHWTAGDLRKQSHIPWHNPFSSKLASLAADVVRAHDLELIESYYLEPYGVAGYLAAEMTGRPHIVRTAGSDIGRLLEHPQLGPIYRHVFARAARILTSARGREKLLASGIPEHQFSAGPGCWPLPMFQPDGPVLDPDAIRAEMEELEHAPVLPSRGLPPRPWIGFYCKLHEPKGIFELLQAVASLASRGPAAGLLILGRGIDAVQARLERDIERLGLRRQVLQLPFVPPWRVPAFLRACRAVCFLEHDFGIPHGPTIPREVLACGRPLVASAEKLMLDHYLDGYMIHRYNCMAVRDVKNINELAACLDEIATDDSLATAIGRRGSELWRSLSKRDAFPLQLEAVFADALGVPALDPSSTDDGSGADDRDTRLREGDALVSAFAQETDEVLEPDGSLNQDGRRTGEALLFRLEGSFRSEDELGALCPSMLPGVQFRAVQGACVALVRAGHRVLGTRVSTVARELIESLDGTRTATEIAETIARGTERPAAVKRAALSAIERYFQLGLVALGSRRDAAGAPIPSQSSGR